MPIKSKTNLAAIAASQQVASLEGGVEPADAERIWGSLGFATDAENHLGRYFVFQHVYDEKSLRPNRLDNLK